MNFGLGNDSQSQKNCEKKKVLKCYKILHIYNLLLHYIINININLAINLLLFSKNWNFLYF